MTPLKSLAGAFALVLAAGWTFAAQAAERDTLRAFLETTGFDVAISSLQQEAMSGPGMSGGEADDFGSQYVKLAERIFEPELMLNRAVDMMQAVMPDDLVDHGAAFYAGDLGQKLVAMENASHMADADARRIEGEAVAAELAASNPDRLEDYQAMMDAIGGVDAGVRAILEVQIRYLMSAMAAGSIELDYSEAELRLLLGEQAAAIREEIARSSIIGAAYTYQSLSDDEVKAYREALEDPQMQDVYEILNAVQFEVMAERYEALAVELAKLAPQTEL